MEPPEHLHHGEQSADEVMLLLAYRRCTDRRKAAVRFFAQALSAIDEADGPDAEIIPLPRPR
jgi:hypothetical protein